MQSNNQRRTRTMTILLKSSKTSKIFWAIKTYRSVSQKLSFAGPIRLRKTIVHLLHPFLQATKALRVSRGITLLFLGPRRTRCWCGISSTLRPSLPPGKIQYPLYRRLGGSQGRSGGEENLVPTGIRSRTVQPVVSRYTDWATRPTSHILAHVNIEYPVDRCPEF